MNQDSHFYIMIKIFLARVNGMRKVSIILGFSLVILYLVITLLLKSENKEQLHDNRLGGSYSMINSPAVILNLWPNHMFTLENKISEKFYGDGNWETKLDGLTILTLDFENGESLNFKYLPHDSLFVNEDNLNLTIKLQKTVKNN